MPDLTSQIRIVAVATHVLAGLTLAWLFSRTGAMAGWCIFPGLLIASAAAASVPGRPTTLYGAFGALLGVSFWSGVASINQGFYLNLVPILLLVAGAAWLLREPGWPPIAFTVAASALEMALKISGYQHRFEIPGADPEAIARSTLTTGVMLVVGVAYAAVGFAEELIGRTRKKKKKSRSIRIPTAPPEI